ncbi:hypothetical protein NHX12_001750 [Muraenolepis orangiensis]|uniref:Uncharacterized protein n=1 Tax=Muraenolepis orangiensis TaxID=630683 RepID=A0A9Q0IGT6_9TELE|nr:hypothetical protein NHX12_001750 [Muraenolepis orangiensis]
MIQTSRTLLENSEAAHERILQTQKAGKTPRKPPPWSYDPGKQTKALLASCSAAVSEATDCTSTAGALVAH